MTRMVSESQQSYSVQSTAPPHYTHVLTPRYQYTTDGVAWLSAGEVQHEDNLLLSLTTGVGMGDDAGDPVSLVRDPIRKTLWMVTTSSIYQVHLMDFVLCVVT